MEENALLYFRLFKDVCQKINSSLNVNEVLKLITENTAKALKTKGCSIFLLNKQKKLLKLSAFH